MEKLTPERENHFNHLIKMLADQRAYKSSLGIRTENMKEIKDQTEKLKEIYLKVINDPKSSL